MSPGEIIPAEGEIILNAGRDAVCVTVSNAGDRPFRSAVTFICRNQSNASIRS